LINIGRSNQPPWDRAKARSYFTDRQCRAIEAPEALDPQRSIGRHYTTDNKARINRRHVGSGYYDHPGSLPVYDPQTLQRIKLLAICPACSAARSWLLAMSRSTICRQQRRRRPDDSVLPMPPVHAPRQFGADRELGAVLEHVSYA
jgi:hypothetical protein